MLDSAMAALASLADPSLLLMLLIGVVAGLVMGLIPGLGGTGAVAILLPVTFGMEAPQALALLIGALAVVHTSDTVSAVLLGAPGSASASVTMLDGYSMARQGQARRALSLAFLSSMAGGITGALGIFGLAEIATRVAQRGHTEQPITLGGTYMEGVREWLTHWTQVIRGALIGIWAGVLPGIGATAGTWLAYGQAVATAKDKRKFGKGDPRR